MVEPVEQMETMRVAVRCKECGRIICYKISAGTGIVAIKCDKCGAEANVNLALRRNTARISYRIVTTPMPFYASLGS